MEKYNLNVFADYFQFLVQDEHASGDISELWTEQAVKDLIVVKNDVIGIGTVRNMTVPFTVEIIENCSNAYSSEKWDQIVECSIDISSGKIVVIGGTDYFPDAPRIKVTPDKYRARIFYGNLDSISDDGLDGNDKYKIVLWRSSEDKGVVFIKKYHKE